VAAAGLAIGLAAGAPAAHAGPGCSWAPITLMNGWHTEQGTYSTGDPSACLEDDGMVYLSGSVGAPGGSPSEFGTLPVWDWPEHNLYFDVYTLNRSYGVLRIDTDGTMWAYGGLGGSTGYTSLAGVSYPGAAVTQTDMTLENGWQSADILYATGDPAFSVTSGIVHLSGSLRRPAGTPPNFSPDWAAAVLPSQAWPSDNCVSPNIYTVSGGIWPLSVDNGTVYGANASYASLAGISYPTAAMAWHSLPLVNGTGPSLCNTGPSYLSSGNVVYLTGVTTVPSGFNGELAVLPAGDRPAHFLYMMAENQGAGPTAADAYVALRIDPSGAVWILTPTGGSADIVSLAGLSFHLGS
jgi:hypothetical protein